MVLDNWANWVSIFSGAVTVFGCLPKSIDNLQSFITKGGFEIKAFNEEIEHLKGYQNYKKSKDEKKRCKAILKKHNLPKSVGVMCKTDNDICFSPSKAIIDKNMNNLHLKSSDKNAELIIGGGCFAFYIKNIVLGIVHQNIMCGTVIRLKDEIYLLRHPLGGTPYYLAKLDLFINGVIIELNDDSKVGLYY